MTLEKVQGDISKRFDKIVRKTLYEKFAGASSQIKAAILSQYDEELVDVVTDINSKTNPTLYRDEFIERLDEFEYVDENGDTLSIRVPDMETFDFSGRMQIIQTIMEGLAGLYVEVNEEDYEAIFGKKPINQNPIDEYVPPKERIYLVRYSNFIKKAERSLKKRFVKYPFSNTPPIKVLEQGAAFVDEHINEWIEDALEEAQREFVRTYRGANL